MPSQKYWNIIKNDPEKYAADKARTNELIKERYKNDPEYRARVKKTANAFYHRKKALLAASTIQTQSD